MDAVSSSDEKTVPSKGGRSRRAGGGAGKANKDSKLSLEAERAPTDLSMFMRQVYAFMNESPERQQQRIISVHPAVPALLKTFPSSRAASDVFDEAIAISNLYNKDRSADALAHKRAVIACYAVVDDPALGFVVFGFSKAPTPAMATEPRFFEMFNVSRLLPQFHPTGFKRKSYFQSRNTSQTLDSYTHAGHTFTFPLYDPRLVVQAWRSGLKATNAPQASLADGGDAADAQEDQDDQTVPTSAAAVELVPPSDEDIDGKLHAVLQAKRARVDDAVRVLPQLIAQNYVRVSSSKTSSAPIAFLPLDFEWNLDALINEPASAVPWQSWPLVLSIFVLPNAEAFSLQGFAAYLEGEDNKDVNGSMLRADTVDATVTRWDTSNYDPELHHANTAAYVTASQTILSYLAVDRSLLFSKAAPLFALAELTERVLAIDMDCRVAADQLKCPFSQQTLKRGDTAIRMLLQLRKETEPVRQVELFLSPAVTEWTLFDSSATTTTATAAAPAPATKKRPRQEPAAPAKPKESRATKKQKVDEKHEEAAEVQPQAPTLHEIETARIDPAAKAQLLLEKNPVYQHMMFVASGGRVKSLHEASVAKLAETLKQTTRETFNTAVVNMDADLQKHAGLLANFFFRLYDTPDAARDALAKHSPAPPPKTSTLFDSDDSDDEPPAPVALATNVNAQREALYRFVLAGQRLERRGEISFKDAYPTLDALRSLSDTSLYYAVFRALFC